MYLWRIASRGRGYGADDLSGTGAKLSGGRWNSKDNALVYCSSSIALAALETLAHLRTGGFPIERFLVRISVPDAVWANRTIARPPRRWDALPSGRASQIYGDAWLASGRSALMVVPSVIVTDEMNVLINPAHHESRRIRAKVQKAWHFDPRLFD